MDPVGHVRDPREYLGQHLVKLAQRDPRVKSLVGAADAAVADPFLQVLAAAGHAF